jgi:hypothetical protein
VATNANTRLNQYVNNLLVTDHILNAVDEKKVNILVLLDLSKAFDGIDHDYGGRRPKQF